MEQFPCLNLMASWVQISRCCFSHCNPYCAMQCQNRLHKFKKEEKEKVLFFLCTVCVGCAGWSQNKHNRTHGRQSGRGNSICWGRLLFVFLNLSGFLFPRTPLHLLRGRHNTEWKAKMPAVTLWGCLMFIPAQCPSAVQSVRVNMVNKHLCVYSSPHQQGERNCRK